MSTYKRFTIETLADGVYAALGPVNAGIIDLGDQTIVFDTTGTVGGGQELRAAAEALTGRPTTYVINSHVHPDHVQGNVAFAHDAVLIASTVTRDALARDGIRQMANMKNDFLTQLGPLREQLTQATTDAERADLQESITFFADMLAEYPTPDDLRIPTLTYEKQLTLHGSKRTAHLLTFGGAHSPCDAVLWLPAEKLLFSADLAIPGGNQIFRNAWPDNWLPILAQLEALGAERLVPGHGGVTPVAEAFAFVRQYLGDIFRLAEEALAAGETAEYAERMPVPEGPGEYWFRINMRYLLEQRLAARTQA